MLLGVAGILKALAWPLVAAGALYLFRDAATDFIKRIQKWEASPAGVKTEMLPPTQQIETLKDAQETVDAEAVSDFAPLDAAYMPEYEKLSAALSRNISGNVQEQIESIKRMAAVIATQKQFEIIHRLIFGSQFQAIVTANQLGGKIPKGEMHKIYLAAAAQSPEIYSTISFEHWLQFLLNTNLLTVGAMTANLVWYEITPFGRMYLTYAIGAQLPPRAL